MVNGGSRHTLLFDPAFTNFVNCKISLVGFCKILFPTKCEDKTVFHYCNESILDIMTMPGFLLWS